MSCPCMLSLSHALGFHFLRVQAEQSASHPDVRQTLLSHFMGSNIIEEKALIQNAITLF